MTPEELEEREQIYVQYVQRLTTINSSLTSISRSLTTTTGSVATTPQQPTSNDKPKRKVKEIMEELGL